MKLYGLGKKIKSNFPDCHPKRGWINWWGDMVSLSKKKARRGGKQQIKKEINE